ncbi:IclR family transcriptional regulator [Actinomycetospora chiangmaiensis]|uniref:IclR family transcriptional regulator n=1 Tax=Actinomycetospora chiangmaiensis TaxID=402650 RepID=UPI000377FED1|nr:IclR family transcriptional regulator [Actinomycetospora chiangmaiensis]
MARSDSGESVLERVLRVLECFTPETPALSVTAIAHRADLPPTTASRLVADLVGHGLLVRDGARLRVGTRLWELGARASSTLSLRETAMPVLEDLHRAVGHHAQLGVLDGDEVLFVERLSAEHAVINLTRIAARLPLHVSSSGLVLLAAASTTLQERVLARPLAGFTRNTITDARVLRARLAEVRDRGVALCPGYVHPDATGVAVPVRDHAGHVVAAVSVVVPNDGEAARTVPALTEAARRIRARLDPS